MNDRKSRTRIISVLTMAGLLAGIFFAQSLFQGCGDDECLSWGENCSQQYLQDNYGTTDIYCCSGQCSDHGSVVVTCGS